MTSHTHTHMDACILTHTCTCTSTRTHAHKTRITNWLYSGRPTPSDSEVATRKECSLKREATTSFATFYTGRDVFVSLPTGIMENQSFNQ